MKMSILFRAVIITSGLLIALGPTFLFKACPLGCCCSIRPNCLWSIRTELGMGMVIAALGISLFLYNNNPKTQVGITIGIFLTGIMVMLIPHVIIGGCAIRFLECHLVAFPVLTILGIFVVLCSGIWILRNLRKVNAAN